jgi:hypothetical protein
MPRARRTQAASGPTPAARLDRWLAIAADAGDDPAAARLRPFLRFVLLWGAARSWIWLGAGAPLAPALLAPSAVALTAAAGLAFAPRQEHAAARVALPALVAQLAAGAALAPNHFFVELYAVTLLALAGRDAALALRGLRWLAAIVLFHTGLQKLFYGHYLHGDFLAFMVGRGERFADLFGWLLSASEVARLQALDPFRDGGGPYRVAQPLFVALSNGVWLAELALPVALILRATRRAAAAAAVAFVLALQLGARELGFALLFGNLLLLFASPAWSRRALAPSAAVALVAFAAGALRLAPGLVSELHLW